MLGVSFFDISIGEVFNSISALSASCDAGIDGIPSLFFKSCAYFFQVLWLIFNKSLKAGLFPSSWKRCIVSPIFKGGGQSAVTNYRPICKQNIMPKRFESIVVEKIGKFCKNIVIN